jgi:putative membrane protein
MPKEPVMNANQPATERFEVRITSDSHFSWIRTRLALERTLMAWVRTSVALIGFGFSIVQFYERLHGMEGVAPAVRPDAPRQLGLALIGAGVLALVISTWQYRTVVRYMWSEEFRVLAGLGSTPMKPVVSQTPLMAITIAVALIGIFAFGSVFFRVV